MICLNLHQISCHAREYKKDQSAGCAFSEQIWDILGCSRISHAFIQETFARCHHCTFIPQPRQRDGHLLLVAAAYSVGNHIDSVSGSDEVDSGLCDADMALNAHKDAREWAGGFQGVESFLHLRCSGAREQVVLAISCGIAVVHHREQRLVNMTDSLDTTRRIQP
jgi:hypothetical protein